MSIRSQFAALAWVPLLSLAGNSWGGTLDVPGPFSAQPRWSLGPFIGTFSGPSHENVLNHVNNTMGRLSGGVLASAFTNFDVGTPVGLRLFRAVNEVVSVSSTYSYSQFFTKGAFTPMEWQSDRSLTTNLHELELAAHYELDFVRGNKIEPYFGVGLDFILADSQLAIDLVNVYGVTEDGEEGGPVLPDRSFEIDSSDFGIGALGLAGLNFNFTRRVALNAEIQGVLGQVRQHFDYDGSLQYISPGSDGVEDPQVNDILMGSYPLDLNGLRLSICLLFRI